MTMAPARQLERITPVAKLSGRWEMKAIQTIPYRHQDWCDQDKVILVEGEKCAEALWGKGIPATCNAGGANKWTAFSMSTLR